MTGISTSPVSGGPIDINEKISFLRSNNYWIGKRPAQSVVEGLYALASKELLSAERWNVLGNSLKQWEDQAEAIQLLSANELDPPKIEPADLEAKAKYLTVNGYWIGKRPGEGVVENLYELAVDSKISADDWNNKGIARLSWDEQSEEIKSLINAAAPEETETAPGTDTSKGVTDAAAEVADEEPEAEKASSVEPETSTPPPAAPDTGKAKAAREMRERLAELQELKKKVEDCTMSDSQKDEGLLGKKAGCKMELNTLRRIKLLKIESEMKVLNKELEKLEEK